MRTKRKSPIWDDSPVGVTPPKDIVCRDCVYRSTLYTNAYKGGRCDKHKGCEKPDGVLWESAPCDFYERDKNL